MNPKRKRLAPSTHIRKLQRTNKALREEKAALEDNIDGLLHGNEVGSIPWLHTQHFEFMVKSVEAVSLLSDSCLKLSLMLEIINQYFDGNGLQPDLMARLNAYASDHNGERLEDEQVCRTAQIIGSKQVPESRPYDSVLGAQQESSHADNG